MTISRMDEENRNIGWRTPDVCPLFLVERAAGYMAERPKAIVAYDAVRRYWIINTYRKSES